MKYYSLRLGALSPGGGGGEGQHAVKVAADVLHGGNGPPAQRWHDLCSLSSPWHGGSRSHMKTFCQFTKAPLVPLIEGKILSYLSVPCCQGTAPLDTLSSSPLSSHSPAPPDPFFRTAGKEHLLLHSQPLRLRAGN